jgi:hypothetical protein
MILPGALLRESTAARSLQRTCTFSSSLDVGPVHLTGQDISGAPVRNVMPAKPVSLAVASSSADGS